MCNCSTYEKVSVAGIVLIFVGALTCLAATALFHADDRAVIARAVIVDCSYAFSCTIVSCCDPTCTVSSQMYSVVWKSNTTNIPDIVVAGSSTCENICYSVRNGLTECHGSCWAIPGEGIVLDYDNTLDKVVQRQLILNVGMGVAILGLAMFIAGCVISWYTSRGEHPSETIVPSIEQSNGVSVTMRESSLSVV